MARRSVGSSERVIQPCSSNASATSVAERGVIRSDEASAEGRTGSAEAITRRARDCAGVIPHASSSRAVSRRISRAAAISRSPVESDIAAPME